MALTATSASAEDWTPIGSDSFSGTFDGQGHIISNLSVKDHEGSTAKSKYGFFENLIGPAVVKNLVFKNAAVKVEHSGWYAGVLAGGSTSEQQDGMPIVVPKISNITIQGTIEVYAKNGWAGALIGGSYSTMTNITINAEAGSFVKGGSAIGGVVGILQGNSGENKNISVNIDVEGESCVGGVVGRINGTHTFDGVKATGNVKATSETGSACAGAFASMADQDNAIAGTLTIKNFNFVGRVDSAMSQDEAFIAIEPGDKADVAEVKIYSSTSSVYYLEGEMEKSFYRYARADAEGVVTDGYAVSDFAGLKYFRDSVNGTEQEAHTYLNQWIRVITADGANVIDLGDQEWTPIGNVAHPFSGHFVGNGVTIKNLKISDIADHAGLFGFVGYASEGGFHENISIEDLTLENVSIAISGEYAGALVAAVNGHTGDSEKVHISNITISGKVEISAGTDYAGGLAGHLFNAQLNDIKFLNLSEGSKISSANTTEVKGQVGAIAGHACGVTVKDVLIDKNLTVEGNWAGGLFGCLEGVQITDANLYGVNVSGKTSYVGAVAGTYNDGANILTNVQFNGTVTTTSDELDMSTHGMVGQHFGENGSLSIVSSKCEIKGITNGYSETTKWDADGAISGVAQISNEAGLGYFAERVNGGFTYENWTVELTNNITLATVAGGGC